MADLTDALNRILAWLQQHTPEAATHLQPGLSPSQISDGLKRLSFQLPQAIYDLYQWRNGDQGCNAIFVYHWLLPLEKALDVSNDVNDEFFIEDRVAEGAPRYLFPLFDFDGEYFAVLGSQEERAESPVYHIGCDDGYVSLAFNSLTQMMLTLAECYESGIYIVDEAGQPTVVDERKFGEVRQKYNPGTVEALFVGGW